MKKTYFLMISIFIGPLHAMDEDDLTPKWTIRVDYSDNNEPTTNEPDKNIVELGNPDDFRKGNDLSNDEFEQAKKNIKKLGTLDESELNRLLAKDNSGYNTQDIREMIKHDKGIPTDEYPDVLHKEDAAELDRLATMINTIQTPSEPNQTSTKDNPVTPRKPSLGWQKPTATLAITGLIALAAYLWYRKPAPEENQKEQVTEPIPSDNSDNKENTTHFKSL